MRPVFAVAAAALAITAGAVVLAGATGPTGRARGGTSGPGRLATDRASSARARTTAARLAATSSAIGTPSPAKVLTSTGMPLPLAGGLMPLASFAGEAVGAQAAPVQSVVSDTSFWVGPSAAERLLVRIEVPGLAGVHLRAGDPVEVHGLLRDVPPDAAQRFSLGPEGLDQLHHQGVYLYATAVRRP